MASESGATVKIGDDGQVLQCAKGMQGGECGYKVGDEVCGKCGAMAVEVKMWGEDSMEEAPVAPMPPKKKKRMTVEEKAAMRAYGDVFEDEEMEDDSDEMEEEEMPALEDPESEDMMDDDSDEMMDDEDEEDLMLDEDEPEDGDLIASMATGRSPIGKGGYVEGVAPMPSAEEEEENYAEIEEMLSEDEESMEERRKMMSDRRLRTMGFKTGEMGNDPFVCAIERKVYPGNSSVCENCPGGCMKEGDMPALLEIEGVAEDMFSGKVLDSGYSDKADVFVVDVERKDGKPIEAFFDGTTGECMGWHMLNEDVLNVKSGFQPSQMVSFSEAAEIATKSINGDVVSVEADVFEGFDTYAVEVEGVDGKSYDVFVSLDGEVLGYDTYTQEEAFAIESEAAEIALKRAYGDDVVKGMVERGEAMGDGEMPIANDADLRNAVMAWPRSKKRDEARAHIIARAKALGLEGSLPDEWMAQHENNEKAAQDANFMSSLMEFEMLTAETEADDPAVLAEAYFKRMFSQERRDDLAKRGMALSDGSYPIESVEDLKNAIQAYGRAKDKEAAKTHIMKRARELGQEDLIPENWK